MYFFKGNEASNAAQVKENTVRRAEVNELPWKIWSLQIILSEL